MDIANPELPLVSALAIVPAGASIQELIACFQAQTYPNKELVIVHNARDLAAAQLLTELPQQVRVVDTGMVLSAGMCRNYALSAAHGNVFVQFDNNCWHHPNRIQHQLEVLMKHDAHICLLSSILEYSYISGFAGYKTTPKNYILGSMMFLQPGMSYPDSNKLEELGLLTAMVKAGQRPISVERPHLMIRLHRGSTSITEPKSLFGNAALLPEHLELVRTIVNIPELNLL